MCQCWNVQAYDFARNVQVSAGVGMNAGGLRNKQRGDRNSDFSGGDHVPKHLNQGAGGAAAHEMDFLKVGEVSGAVSGGGSGSGGSAYGHRKRVTKDRNEESGAIRGMVGPNYLRYMKCWYCVLCKRSQSTKDRSTRAVVFIRAIVFFIF
jgi:hypothetical protein